MSPRYHDGADVTPPIHYPLALDPARLAMYDSEHRAESWFFFRLSPTLRRVARHWLRAHVVFGHAVTFRLTVDGRVSIHVHAYSRRSQRRVQAVAEGLARRLARTVVAAGGPSWDIHAVVVSWGFDPHALAAEDRRRARVAVEAVVIP
jgi:hypothetical protein